MARARGGDTGSYVAPAMGRQDPRRVLGVHVNALVTYPIGADGELDGLTEAEQRRGGHFFAMEQPGPFVTDVRDFFRTVR